MPTWLPWKSTEQFAQGEAQQVLLGLLQGPALRAQPGMELQRLISLQQRPPPQLQSQQAMSVAFFPLPPQWPSIPAPYPW